MKSNLITSLLVLCGTLLVAGTALAQPPLPLHENEDELTAIAKAWEQILPVRDSNNKVVLTMPGTKRGTQELDERPVLPLAWDDAPYPGENHPDIEKFLDHRTKNERYLRKPPSNVDMETHEVANTNGVKSFFDHPGVQPRAHRSQHYRLNVRNEDFVPVPYGPDRKASLQERREFSNKMAGTVYSEKSERRFETLPEIHARQNLFVTYVKTASGMYPEVDPFLHPPGTNMLPTVYQNMRTRKNRVMPNTLPSHPNNPYNLHDGEPVVTRLKTLSSPADDLRLILQDMFEMLTGIPHRRLWEQLDGLTFEELLEEAEDHESQIRRHREQLLRLSQWGIDILEGNDGHQSKIPSNRAYRGFALLNHSGHKYRNKRAMPIYGDKGEIVSANIDTHQIWYGGRIQSDTMFYDFGWDDEPLMVKTERGVEKQWFSTYDPNWDWALLKPKTNGGKQDENGNVTTKDVAKLKRNPEPIPPGVSWTVTYTLDVLNRGEDDFSPTQVYFDDPEPIDGTNKVPAYRVYDPTTGKNKMTRFGPPHIAMDQT